VQKDAPLLLLSTFQRFFPLIEPTLTLQAPGYDAWIAGTPTQDGRLVLACGERGSRVAFTWQSARAGRTLEGRPIPVWARVPLAVIVKLCAEGFDVSGLNAAVVTGQSQGLARNDYAMGAAVATLLYALNGHHYPHDVLVATIDAALR
jgi:hypothetical protein